MSGLTTFCGHGSPRVRDSLSRCHGYFWSVVAMEPGFQWQLPRVFVAEAAGNGAIMAAIRYWGGT